MTVTINDSTAADASAAGALAQRYGTGPRRQRGQRRMVMLVAIALLAAFAVWLIWRASTGADVPIDARVVSFEAIDDTAMDLTVLIDFDPAATASCALEVQGDAKSIVGWLVIDLPAGGDRSRLVTQRINTTEKGVTGLISRCWLT